MPHAIPHRQKLTRLIDLRSIKAPCRTSKWLVSEMQFMPRAHRPCHWAARLPEIEAPGALHALGLARTWSGRAFLLVFDALETTSNDVKNTYTCRRHVRTLTWRRPKIFVVLPVSDSSRDLKLAGSTGVDDGANCKSKRATLCSEANNKSRYISGSCHECMMRDIGSYRKCIVMFEEVHAPFSAVTISPVDYEVIDDRRASIHNISSGTSTNLRRALKADDATSIFCNI